MPELRINIGLGEGLPDLRHTLPDIGAINFFYIESVDVPVYFERFSGIDKRHDVGPAEPYYHAWWTTTLIDAGASENLLKARS